MGVLLSKLWKKLTKEEELKRVVEKMREIQEFKRSTQLQQKKMVANLILYGCVVYIFVTIVIGIWFLPDSLIVRACLLIPLILVPFIIYGLKQLLSWFFETKMTRANEKYETLTREKQKIITTIMDTETFNKAKSILALYAPEHLDKKDFAGAMELRRRANAAKEDPAKPPATAADAGTVAVAQTAVARVDAALQTPANITGQRIPVGTRLATPRTAGLMLKAQLPLPQPLFPKDRSFGDKLVEYIVGDGPSYRYALICKQCREHNGMALKEEFPYMSFHCCYCRTFNPSTVSRPAAPRLPAPPATPSLPSEKPSPPRYTVDQFLQMSTETEGAGNPNQPIIEAEAEEEEEEGAPEVTEGQESTDPVEESAEDKKEEPAVEETAAQTSEEGQEKNAGGDK